VRKKKDEFAFALIGKCGTKYLNIFSGGKLMAREGKP